MLKFKRNFSLLGSPVGSSTPSKIIRCSPSKSIRSSPSKFIRSSPSKLIRSSPRTPLLTEPQAIETPPPSPKTPTLQLGETEALAKEVAALKAEIQELDAKLEAKYQNFREKEAEASALQVKNWIVEDLIAAAINSQQDTRSYLKDVFNHGEQCAATAKAIMEEAKKSHVRNFERLCFEMKQHMEAARVAIKRKEEELRHEIDLHQRTLLTYEHSREEGDKMVAEDESSIKRDDQSTIEDRTEDDCVILDDEATSIQTPEEREVPQDPEDDELTDIDEPKVEGDGSFTPCQAQRQNV